LYCIASAAFSPSYAYALVLLASAEKAVWSQEETSALVHYLYKHRSQAGNRANFKAATFEAAADAISHLWKMVRKRRGKCARQNGRAIQKYRASGMHWGIVNGAGINGEEAERAWNSYITQKCNRAMKPFRNTGWLYYGKVHAINNSVSSLRY
ncbi:hypothetical protein BJV77DRAFT_981661, partial [Russula vinacea]